MNKMLFLLFLIPICFCIDCSSIDTKEIGASSINYSVFGLVDLNFNEFTFENFSFTFRGVPQVSLGEYVTNGMISKDSFNNTILFFHQPQITQNLDWYFNSTLSLSYSNEKLPKNVEFPYSKELPADIKKFLEFTQTANEDLRIKILTNNLLAGVNDYLTAVALISEFTAYYITYDLNYFSTNSANASEIYDAKRGVCDEFSTLTISMFRSVGIPARYVSGYVYTNIGSDGCTNFEPHSWIEVYVPENGWVNIDPTYKEFFWINSAHLPLYKNYDLLDISSLYLQRKGSDGSNFLNKNSYNFNIDLLDYQKTESELILEVSSNSTVAQNNYLLVNVSITNPTTYWVLDTLISTPIRTIELLNANPSIPLVIPPLQSVNKYFIFKMPDLGCASACYSDASFKFSLGGGKSHYKIVRIDSELSETITFEDLSAIIKEDDKILSPELVISNIKFNKNKFLEQKPVLSFLLKNIGNAMININLTIQYGEIILNENFENVLINEQRQFEKELELPAQKGLIDVILNFGFANTSINYNSSFIALQEPPYEISISKTGDFSYAAVLNTQELEFNGTVTAYLNEKEVARQNVEKTNNFSLNEQDFEEGNNDIKFVFDYIQGGNYYFKTINVQHPYSLGIFEKISKFITSIINIFKILLSA